MSAVFGVIIFTAISFCDHTTSNGEGHRILDFVALIVLAAVAKAEQDIARKKECGNILWTENKAL